MSKLKKGALCTDIHFGKKANSETHNQDCLNYLEWFCDYVRNDPTIDYVAFLGDWNENRSSLNIQTLNYSYQGAKMLNDLGLPVYFIVGNHDLYHKHTREVHSVIPFSEFDNFVVIDEPTVVEDIEGGVLFSPYLFHDEYPTLTKYLHVPFWAGHFEFKGFEVTGYGMKMPTGPEPEDFAGPDHIVSGHFHKRQAQPGNNVVYIGNCFPMDFGDAGDGERGLAIYDHSKKDLFFEDWPGCPMYIKTTLTDILDGSVDLPEGSRVKCLIDVPITFEESTTLKHSLTEKHDLREFTMEESHELREVLSETEVDITTESELVGVDELVEQMLHEIDSDHISNDILIEVYQKLRTP